MSRQNENKASSTIDVSESNAKKEDAKPSEEKQIQSRRSILGAGLAGLATAIVAACAGSDFASTGGNNRIKGKKAVNKENFDGDGVDGVDTPDADDSPGDGPGSGTEDGDDLPDPKQEIDKCAATTPQKIDTTGMPAIDNAPVVRIYGKRKSRMVAIQFASGTTFDQLLIASASGRVLALHVPTGADRNSSGWRPIVIDPLNFDEGANESAEIVIVLQIGNERKQHREALKLFDKFEGKDVVDLSTPTAGSGWDFTKQSTARFVNSGLGYLNDDNPSIIYPGNRKLKTAQQNLSLAVSQSVLKTGQKPIPMLISEGRITDIMGNVIAHTELEGSGLLETPLFCTYRPTADGTKYIRTMIYVA
jgi:hypothetical protein